MPSKGPFDSFFSLAEGIVGGLENNHRLQSGDSSDSKDDIIDAEIVSETKSRNEVQSIHHLRSDLYSFYGKHRKDKQLMEEFREMIEELNHVVTR